MASTPALRLVDSGPSEEFRIVLNGNEILHLDEYFTRHVGYIGYEHPADLAAHMLANIISDKAEELRKSADNSNR